MGEGERRQYNQLIDKEDLILGDIVRKPGIGQFSRGYLRAGPRKTLYFEPKQVTAAIVTCGGLCPGLNSIIQGITNCMWRDYGVRHIVGITSGYNGLSDPAKHPPITLTPGVAVRAHVRRHQYWHAIVQVFDGLVLRVHLPVLCEELALEGIFTLVGPGARKGINLTHGRWKGHDRSAGSSEGSSEVDLKATTDITSTAAATASFAGYLLSYMRREFTRVSTDITRYRAASARTASAARTCGRGDAPSTPRASCGAYQRDGEG